MSDGLLSYFESHRAPVVPATPTRAGTTWFIPGGHVSQLPQPGHEALDIAAPLGTPIYAPTSGIVEKIQNLGTYGYGRDIRIIAPSGLEELFGHLSEQDVYPGEPISAGQFIGRVGSTGYSTGPHTHFEVRKPGPDIFARGSRSTTTAIDPLSFLFGQNVAVVQPPSGGGASNSLLQYFESHRAAPSVPSAPAPVSPLASLPTVGGPDTFAPAQLPVVTPQGGQTSAAQTQAPAQTQPQGGGVFSGLTNYIGQQAEKTTLIAVGVGLILVGVLIFAFSSSGKAREVIVKGEQARWNIGRTIAAGLA